jgi:hypothetical protein
MMQQAMLEVKAEVPSGKCPLCGEHLRPLWGTENIVKGAKRLTLL